MGIRVYCHYLIAGYPTNIPVIVSENGYGKNDYIETSRPLVVVTAPDQEVEKWLSASPSSITNWNAESVPVMPSLKHISYLEYPAEASGQLSYSTHCRSGTMQI